jgi:hypothetical protein
MGNLKEVQVVMLPAEDRTDIIVPTRGVGKNVLHYRKYYGPAISYMGDSYQHLYFTSEEEIKERDWIVYDHHIEQAGRVESQTAYYGFKKIIASTDPKLYTSEIVEEDMHMHKKSIPQIPQSFIKEYVKQSGIDKVVIEWNHRITNLLTTNEPKVNSNNEITIHPIKEKMYTKDEVDMLMNAILTDTLVFKNNRELLKSPHSNAIAQHVIDWVKENL